MKIFFATIFYFSLCQFAYGQKFVTVFKSVIIDDKTNINSGYFREILPTDLDGRQSIKEITLNPEPNRLFMESGAKHAEWDLIDFRKGDSIQIIYKLVLNKFDLNIAKEKSIVPPKVIELDHYLKSEWNLPVDKKIIQKLAKTLKADNEIESVNNIFDFVIENTEYKRFSDQRRGAMKVLRQGKGDCTEYSELMIALCRSIKIPSRIVFGMTLNGSGSIGLHNWVEVYFEELGWVPFDPTFADSKQAITDFNNMQNKYIYLSNNRDDLQSKYRYYGKASKLAFTVYNSWIDSNLYLINEAKKHYKNGNNTQAIPILNRLMEMDSSVYWFPMYQGIVYARLKNYSKANKMLYSAWQKTKHKRDSMNMKYTYANYFALRGDTTLAIQYLEEAIDLGYDNIDHLKSDEDLISLKLHPRFIEIVDDLEDQ